MHIAKTIPILQQSRYTAPFDGTVALVVSDNPGEQVWLRPDSHPQYLVEIFHMRRNQGIKHGTRIRAGQKIGHHFNGESQSDMLVTMHGVWKRRNISYFDVITDEVFAQYQALGIKERSDFIISKEERDRNPLKCGWSPTKTALFKEDEPRDSAFVELRSRPQDEAAPLPDGASPQLQYPADTASPPVLQP